MKETKKQENTAISENTAAATKFSSDWFKKITNELTGLLNGVIP
ncbi:MULTISPECIES: hypothetical protein [unclassified Serratia (in: enterobacteria)]